MTRGLVIVDIQRDYFPGGAYPLVEPEAAAGAARRVLDHFRAEGEPVVHLQHVWDAPDATFMRPGTDGVEIHPEVAPADGEPSSRRRTRTASSTNRRAPTPGSRSAAACVAASARALLSSR